MHGETAMSKQQMIEAIRQVNRSASDVFLDAFEQPQLDRYLRRLCEVHNHRGSTSRWVREPETPAIVSRMA